MSQSPLPAAQACCIVVLGHTRPTSTGGGELTDIVVSTLLARGMALVSRIREAP